MSTVSSSLIEIFVGEIFTKDFVSQSQFPQFPSFRLDQIPRTGFLDQIQELLEKTMKKNILQRKVRIGFDFFLRKTGVKYMKGGCFFVGR